MTTTATPSYDALAANWLRLYRLGHLQSMKTLDLFNRDLKPFVRDLQARSDAIGGQVVAETVLLTVLPLSAEEAQAYAAGLDEQLGIYESDLLVVQDNLNAAMALEPNAMAAAKSAQELFALIDTRLAEELMFRNGFAIEDIAGIRDNLGSFQRRVQSAFAEVRAASAAVDAIVAQASATHNAANKLYWQLTRDLLVARMKAQGIQPCGPGARSPPRPRPGRARSARPTAPPATAGGAAARRIRPTRGARRSTGGSGRRRRPRSR